MGLIKEFKEFALKGNVMDMAVGVLIGGAFSGIVTALTTDFINPLIASAGGADVAGMIYLPWVDYSQFATLEEKAAMALNYGDFISAIINFLIIAVILFAIVKAVNKLKSIGQKPEEEVVEEDPADIALLKEILVQLKVSNGVPVEEDKAE